MAIFDRGSKIPAACLAPEPSAHMVRVIKSADADAYLAPEHRGHAHNPKEPRKPAEVRLVATGPDYCDLELICGCGEVTRFRAWNSPGAAAA